VEAVVAPFLEVEAVVAPFPEEVELMCMRLLDLRQLPHLFSWRDR
jgi:hypothetical protein